jgi:comEA protein
MMERSKVRVLTWNRLRASARVVAAALVFLTALAAVGARAEDGARIDLNSATAAELESLPGVGPAKAQAILAHRETAPFKNTEELIDVKGIGEKLYAQLKDKVMVSGAASAGSRAKAAGDAAAAPADARNGRTASAAGAH